MQWAPQPGLGFTTGTPWERAQSDSFTTTVASEESDPGSLLNLYRRLIHLRRQNEALATGTLVPLTTGSPQVAAYLRRAGIHAVLVVANLGDAAAGSVPVNSAAAVLPPGRYAARNLLGDPDGAALHVRADGRITGYVPTGTLGARESLVLNLVRR
jgi:glycosidase